jgi:predicted phosphodiesterase
VKALGVLAVGGLGTLLLVYGQGNRRNGGNPQRAGGPTTAYRIDVPKSTLDVIAGAPTDRSIILSIRNLTDSVGRLKVVDASERVVREIDAPAQVSPKELRLDGLQPSERYRFDLSAGDQTVSGHFTTAKKQDAEFTFVVQADSHLDGNSDTKVYERTLKNMVVDQPDFLVDLGDTFMVDKYQNFADSEKQYLAQRYWFSRVGSEMSVFLCLGNHDGEAGWKTRNGQNTTEWSQAHREANFPVIKSGDFYSGAPRKGLYYNWKWGAAEFWVLDPFVATTTKTRNDEDGWNWTLGKTQFSWFEKTLKASKAAHKFVFIHHLVGGFGKDARGGAEAVDRFEWGDVKKFPNERPGWAEPIHRLMVNAKVTALFHGHDHLYVRQEKDGVRYIEVPQPSHGRGDQTNSAEEYGYTSGKLLGSSGHIRVRVSEKKVTMEYVKSLAGSDNRKVVDQVELSSR